jgi:hypothetical protein
VANKKEWRRRAKLAVSAQKEAEAKLNVAREILAKAELPGPTLNLWSSQVCALLLQVVEVLGAPMPIDLRTTGFERKIEMPPSINPHLPPLPESHEDQVEDGIYTLPTVDELERWGKGDRHATGS